MAAHEGGHLPFEADVSAHVQKHENCITVAVNNTLFNHSIPQGEVIFNTNDTERSFFITFMCKKKHFYFIRYPRDYLANTYTFDFFNYAGIHRTVHLILQPATNIRDLTVHTTKLVRVGEDLGHGLGKKIKISELLNNVIFFNFSSALLEFEIDMELGSQTASRPLQCLVVLQDEDAQTKAATQVDAVQTTCKGKLEVRAAKLWWPIGSRPQPGYRHTVRVGLYDQNLTLVDSYDLKFGIRTVTWDNDGLFVNQEPFYLKGIGRHEDSDVIQ